MHAVPPGLGPNTPTDNCGDLGQSVCADGSCKEPYGAVNVGGNDFICRKPEEFEQQGMLLGFRRTVCHL